MDWQIWTYIRRHRQTERAMGEYERDRENTRKKDRLGCWERESRGGSDKEGGA